MRSARISRSRPPRACIFPPVRASSRSDPDVRASFAVRQIHVEHVRFRDALESGQQVARAMPCAVRSARRSGDELHFIEGRDLLMRKPQPGSGESTFRARAAGLCQPLRNRRCNFRPQSYRFKITLRHKKILRENSSVWLEGYHAARKRFQFTREGCFQTFEAERNLWTRRLAFGAAFSAKVECVRQQRRDP